MHFYFADKKTRIKAQVTRQVAVERPVGQCIEVHAYVIVEEKLPDGRWQRRDVADAVTTVRPGELEQEQFDGWSGYPFSPDPNFFYTWPKVEEYPVW